MCPESVQHIGACTRESVIVENGAFCRHLSKNNDALFTPENEPENKSPYNFQHTLVCHPYSGMQKRNFFCSLNKEQYKQLILFPKLLITSLLHKWDAQFSLICKAHYQCTIPENCKQIGPVLFKLWIAECVDPLILMVNLTVLATKVADPQRRLSARSTETTLLILMMLMFLERELNEDVNGVNKIHITWYLNFLSILENKKGSLVSGKRGGTYFDGL